MVLDALVNPKTGAVKSLAEIDAVGHRVVHGGETVSYTHLLSGYSDAFKPRSKQT